MKTNEINNKKEISYTKKLMITTTDKERKLINKYLNLMREKKEKERGIKVRGDRYISLDIGLIGGVLGRVGGDGDSKDLDISLCGNSRVFGGLKSSFNQKPLKISNTKRGRFMCKKAKTTGGISLKLSDTTQGNKVIKKMSIYMGYIKISSQWGLKSILKVLKKVNSRGVYYA